VWCLIYKPLLFLSCSLFFFHLGYVELLCSTSTGTCESKCMYLAAYYFWTLSVFWGFTLRLAGSTFPSHTLRHGLTAMQSVSFPPKMKFPDETLQGCATLLVCIVHHHSYSVDTASQYPGEWRKHLHCKMLRIARPVSGNCFPKSCWTALIVKSVKHPVQLG
jgi:hypothetical protein